MDNGWEDLGDEENKKRYKRGTLLMRRFFVGYAISAISMFLGWALSTLIK